MQEKNFAEDHAFLAKHVETIVIKNDEGAAVAIVPQYQGRTMTSTACHQSGQSYGYVNYAPIASDNVDRQINLYGGEDRLWVSPEGGQYSVFFDPQAEMNFDNWRTPPVLDTQAFDVLEKTESSVRLGKPATFTNWSGTEFQTRLEREVRLLDRKKATKHLGISPTDVKLCAHESHNTLTNTSDRDWDPASGLIGIWMLCMSKPAPKATLIVPFNEFTLEDLKQVPDKTIVNSDYFGKLDERRLKIDRDRKLIFFLGDGQLRSKLGLTFGRVTPRLGSWDPSRGVLSYVEFNLPNEAPHGYNNNLWEMQDQPYAGDVINCYNDGLNDSGNSLGAGGFYELETISPALALKSNESYTHVHRTIRMEAEAGDSPAGREALSRIAVHVFGVDLDEIEGQFG